MEADQKEGGILDEVYFEEKKQFLKDNRVNVISRAALCLLLVGKIVYSLFRGDLAFGFVQPSTERFAFLLGMLLPILIYGWYIWSNLIRIRIESGHYWRNPQLKRHFVIPFIMLSVVIGFSQLFGGFKLFSAGFMVLAFVSWLIAIIALLLLPRELKYLDTST